MTNDVGAADAQRPEKVGAVDASADFFKRRAGDAKPSDLLPFLENARNEPPPPGDELE